MSYSLTLYQTFVVVWVVSWSPLTKCLISTCKWISSIIFSLGLCYFILGELFLSSIYLLLNFMIPFLLPVQYSTIKMKYNLLIHSSVEGHLHCFQYLVIVNRRTVFDPFLCSILSLKHPLSKCVKEWYSSILS